MAPARKGGVRRAAARRLAHRAAGARHRERRLRCGRQPRGHEIPPGGGDGIEFWGSSFLCDPQGAVLAEASTDREEILFAEVDLARIEEVRRNWPFLRDRRIDAYGGITSRVLDDEPWGKGR